MVGGSEARRVNGQVTTGQWRGLDLSTQLTARGAPRWESATTRMRQAPAPDDLRSHQGGCAAEVDQRSHERDAHVRRRRRKRSLWAKYLDRWLRDAAKPTLKATTYANYERAVEQSIKPYLGGVKLDKITALQIHGMYSTLQKEGASADKIRTTHAVLHRALKQAVRWRLLPFNVCCGRGTPQGRANRDLAAGGRRSGQVAQGRRGRSLRGDVRPGCHGWHAARGVVRPAVGRTSTSRARR
jgi:hypothetical protein